MAENVRPLCPSIKEIEDCLRDNLGVDNTCVNWLLSEYHDANARIAELEALLNDALDASKAVSEEYTECLAVVDKLERDNATLNVTLFHVENGLGHPSEQVRLLIKAATAAKETP